MIFFDISIDAVNLPFMGNFCLYPETYAFVSVLRILGFGFILLTKVTLSKFIELSVSTSNLHFCPLIKISAFGGFLFTW